MEFCRICNSDYKKAFKSDHYKSVNHQEKLGQDYCKKCILYLHFSTKFIHLNSDDHKNHHNKVWCEDCKKHISDKARHFQSEIHRRNRQKNQLNQQINFSLDTQSA